MRKDRKALIYARVSTREQLEGTSLDDQVAKCEAYAALHGWDIVGVHIDEGVSGAKPLKDRPEGSKLLAAVGAGDADAVICLKVDRFTRSLTKGATDLEALADRKVAFISVNEEFNTKTPNGRFFLRMLVLFADFERDRIAERMADGRAGIVDRYMNDQGRVTRWIGGHLPYGYDSDNGEPIAIVPEEVRAVRLIFRLRGEGLSTTSIAEEVREAGFEPRVRNGTQHPFSADLVNEILNQTAYRGDGIERKLAGHDPSDCRSKKSRGDCRRCNTVPPVLFEAEAIVTPEAWALAHEARRGVQRVPNAGEKINTYALSERIAHRHGDGTTAGMYGNTRPTAQSDKTRWYRCMAARKGADGSAPTCDGFGPLYGSQATAVGASVIEAAVLRRLIETKPEDILARLQEADEAYLAGTSAETLEEDEAQLARLTRQRDGYLDQEAAGLIPRDKLIVKLRQMDERILPLTERIDRARQRLAHSEAWHGSIDELLSAEIGPEGDPSDGIDADEVTLGPATTGNKLYEACRRTLDTEPDKYGRTPLLPDWAVEQAARLFKKFGVEVTLSPSDDPRRPQFEIAFNPGTVVFDQEGSLRLENLMSR